MRFVNLKRWYFLGMILSLLLSFLETQIASAALIMSMRNHHKKHQNTRPMIQANQSRCSLFLGTWVRDESYPLYQSSNCPIIEPQFDCLKYGRPDSDYLKYRWKPLNCELPRFSGAEFVSKMEGKTILFVGDSLGKNQWQSLICLILADLPSSASTQMSRGLPLSIFKFLDYGLSIEFYKAPYLVDIDVVQGKRVLKLQDISGNGNAWRNADVLVFNTGHWWSHLGSLQGWDYMESGGTYYQDMNRLDALEKAVRTWANWVDNNIDITRTRIFFQSISPTHYNPTEWGGGGGDSMTTSTGNCYGETEPTLTRTTTIYEGSDLDQLRVEDEIIKEMHSPVNLLDISMLSELRKDCHPSIYSGDLTPQQRAKPFQFGDCSHWCLPGLPDTWNQLFYTQLFF